MANDEWRTPPEVFDALNQEFGFCADMACTGESALCHPLFFTKTDDSLSFRWAPVVRTLYAHPRIYAWCNPPYSDPMPWVGKAIEAQRDGLGVVMLLNADTSVGWFAEALKTVSEIRYIIADKTREGKRPYSSGRLGFIADDGKPAKANNKGQVILVFDPRRIGAQETRYIRKSGIYGGDVS